MDIDIDKVLKKKSLLKKLDEGETVIMGIPVHKVNQKGKLSQRVLVLTNKNIVNVKNTYNALQKVFVSPVRSKVNIVKIHRVVISKVCNMFVIKVKNEYDYLYQSPMKYEFIKNLYKQFLVVKEKFGMNIQMEFLIVEELSLHKFVFAKDSQKEKVTSFDKFYKQYDVKKFDKKIESLQKLQESQYDQSKQMKLDDFVLVKQIGRGGFGKVFLVLNKKNNKYYAMKSLKKEQIIQNFQMNNVISEKNILQSNNFPFVVRLKYFFQMETKLFFLTKFYQGGDLLFLVMNQSEKILSEKMVRFYVSQIILTLEYLHSNQIVYRDLKLENILIDKDGYIKLIDFGLSKKLENNKQCKTMAGTNFYLSPEIINNVNYDYSCDFWSLGILMYMMSNGVPPFLGSNDYEVYENILKKQLVFKQDGLSDELKDLISSLLVKNIDSRLKDIEQIKQHPFFKSVDFDKILKKEVKPDFIPKLKQKDDLKYFECDDYDQETQFSFVNSQQCNVINRFNKQFKNNLVDFEDQQQSD